LIERSIIKAEIEDYVTTHMQEHIIQWTLNKGVGFIL